MKKETYPLTIADTDTGIDLNVKLGKKITCKILAKERRTNLEALTNSMNDDQFNYMLYMADMVLKGLTPNMVINDCRINDKMFHKDQTGLSQSLFLKDDEVVDPYFVKLSALNKEEYFKSN